MAQFDSEMAEKVSHYCNCFGIDFYCIYGSAGSDTYLWYCGASEYGNQFLGWENQLYF